MKEKMDKRRMEKRGERGSKKKGGGNSEEIHRNEKMKVGGIIHGENMV